MLKIISGIYTAGFCHHCLTHVVWSPEILFADDQSDLLDEGPESWMSLAGGQGEDCSWPCTDSHLGPQFQTFKLVKTTERFDTAVSLNHCIVLRQINIIRFLNVLYVDTDFEKTSDMK